MCCNIIILCNLYPTSVREVSSGQIRVLIFKGRHRVLLSVSLVSGSHILEGHIVLLGSDLGSISGKVVHGSTEVGVHTVWCVRVV